MPIVNDAASVKSDTLTLLLCNAMHRGRPLKAHAGAIRACIARIEPRTNDEVLKGAYKKIKKCKNDGQVLQLMALAEEKYCQDYL